MHIDAQFNYSNMAHSICFPSKLFKKKLAVGIDGGSSCFKFAYTTDESDGMRCNFVTIPKLDREKALEFMRQVCEKSNLEPDSEISICGATNNILMEDIRKVTKLKANSVFEIGMMVKGFHFLSNQLPWMEFVTMASEKAKKNSEAIATSKKRVYESFQKYDDTYIISRALKGDIQGLEEPRTQITYPAILYLLGSVPAAMKIYEDGSYEFLYWRPLGGKSFIGLGYYLTGVRTFSELHALAEAGDVNKVNVVLDSESLGTNEGVYNMGETGLVAFEFGHLADKPDGEFKKEDMAAALMSTITRDIADDAYRVAARHNIKQVFFCGSFACASDLIRDQLSTEYIHQCLTNNQEDRSDHYFIKEGAYLGAIGCLLKNLAD